MAKKQISVIMFGPLFTLAERLFNTALAEALQRQSHDRLRVTLPQVEAKKHIVNGRPDFAGIREECLYNAAGHDVAIAILDGADADSGTSVEIGYRKGKDARALTIGVRTDFRASEDGGVNCMLNLCDEIVYAPSSETSVDELAALLIVAINRR